jgi:hypothetical protein
MSQVSAKDAFPHTGPHAPDPGGAGGHAHHQSFWLWVMCLTGVDYFSTLGYQPSIAFEATGLLTPFATGILVLVTLLGALPVYCYVAGKSLRGQGSIGMLEKLVQGWTGKILVLVLLGFTATSFVITKTLSAADAAAHLIKNPLWPADLKFSHAQLVVTIVLLVALGAMFLRDFREVIGLAVVIVAVYLFLNLIVVGSGLFYLLAHPQEVLEPWYRTVTTPGADLHFEHAPFETGGRWLGILAVCLLLFPKLALGLSGFETGVAVMPLIKGRPDDTPERPHGRVVNTRKLLLTAAVIMSCFLLGSSLVTSTLIPPREMQKGGAADERALAYIAHGEEVVARPSPARGQPPETQRATVLNPLFGAIFGTLYDLSTVVILWFAGASAMAGLLNLVPQYLPRYGMAPKWALAVRPLVVLFTLISLFVTWLFNADVNAQGAAYATGVLVLMSSACVATLIDVWRQRTGRSWVVRISWPFALITAVFFYTTLANVIEKPDGIKIASFFILAIIVSSAISRTVRSKELRFTGWRFVDEHSRFLWDSLKLLEFPVLVPHRPGTRSLPSKEESIRQEHRLTPDVPIVFVEAYLGDVSDFYQNPMIEVKQEQGRFIIKVTHCASIAHTIAALALELSKFGKPPEIHFGWSAESPMAANLSFLLFGEGNVPWMVRELVLDAEPDPERQPRVVIG